MAPPEANPTATDLSAHECIELAENAPDRPRLPSLVVNPTRPRVLNRWPWVLWPCPRTPRHADLPARPTHRPTHSTDRS